MLVLNYPNNPTGASATPEFFAEVVEFAQKNQLVVIHDAAYAALVFEGKPLSFLATPGAKEVGVELHSTSKSFNMTGWRCGFVAGNELLVKAYGDVKDNTDSGQFLAIQHAAAYCFRSSGNHGKNRGEIFAAHGAAGGRCCGGAGFNARKPQGLVLPLCRGAEGGGAEGRRADRVPQRRGGFAMADHGEIDFHRAVG